MCILIAAGAYFLLRFLAGAQLPGKERWFRTVSIIICTSAAFLVLVVPVWSARTTAHNLKKGTSATYDVVLKKDKDGAPSAQEKLVQYHHRGSLIGRAGESIFIYPANNGTEGGDTERRVVILPKANIHSVVFCSNPSSGSDASSLLNWITGRRPAESCPSP